MSVAGMALSGGAGSASAASGSGGEQTSGGGFGTIRAADQLLLGHRKVESTVLYLGVEVDDALEISAGIDA